MPERREHAHGTPAWVDIGTEVEGARKFYGSLFGWEASDTGPVEETGGYGMFSKNGKLVAGFGPQQSPGPPYWTTYVSVADADEVATKVRHAGGDVVVEPMDVMDAGRMAVFMDPEGAYFSVWQPGAHIGAQLVNDPGSLCWNELNTRNTENAKAFYGATFGWNSETQQGPMGSYTEFRIDDSPIAGMMDMTGRVPDEVPPHWLVYFAVEDCDATVAKAEDLGGSVVVPAMDVQVGRFSVLRDPQGAAFAVIKLEGAAR